MRGRHDAPRRIQLSGKEKSDCLLTEGIQPDIVSNMQSNSMQAIPASRLRPLRDEAYDRLRNAILTGEHQSGDWLREEELSHRLGISRMPVREALRRLENEGFLEHFPNRGSQVTEVPIEDMTEIYDARMFVESRMAKLAAQRITSGQLERMRVNLERFKQAQGAELAQLASEFNEILMEACHSKALKILGRTIADLAVRLRHRTHSNPSRKENTLQEHTRIYEMLAKGDPDLAEAATRAHVSAVKARALAEQPSGKNLPGE